MSAKSVPTVREAVDGLVSTNAAGRRVNLSNPQVDVIAALAGIERLEYLNLKALRRDDAARLESAARAIRAARELSQEGKASLRVLWDEFLAAVLALAAACDDDAA